MLVENDICKGIVYPEYIESIFRSNQLYLILLDKRESAKVPNKSKVKISKPIGFVLGRINTEDDLKNPTKETYIDVICSCPKTGSFLLNYFIQFSEANSFNAVSLSSLDYVLTFYSRPEFGFKNTKSCQKGTPIFVPGENIKRDMMSPEYKGKVPVEIPVFLEYLETLRHNGFGIVEGQCDPVKNPDLSETDYKKYQCGMNGYMMRRCMNGGSYNKKIEMTPMRLVLNKLV